MTPILVEDPAIGRAHALTDFVAQSEEASMKKNLAIPDDLYDVEPAEHGGDEGSSSSHVGGADDALGLYLKQMGAIPLLNREKELNLATRLEKARLRYRRAVLFCWWSQQRLVGVFERIKDGTMPIDPQIDVVHSLKLDRDTITKRLPHNLRTLNKLLSTASKDFSVFQRTRTPKGRARIQRQRLRSIRKAIKLMEELSPRTELLDAMADEFGRMMHQVRELERKANQTGRSASAREQQRRAVKDLRNLTHEVLATSDEMHRL
ncbi:MAG TPA: sigma-70 factor domain-containing protein, partial [Gemmataceae bacterium]|nr:sigma-70 factor domain-containing protein [Gemmataceae bacterium]